MPDDGDACRGRQVRDSHDAIDEGAPDGSSGAKDVMPGM